jgi:hypothetical protein
MAHERELVTDSESAEAVHNAYKRERNKNVAALDKKHHRWIVIGRLLMKRQEERSST